MDPALVDADSESPPRFAQLVAHPLRWRLLRELVQSDRAVWELTDRLGTPQNLVSYHLRQLRDGGLVQARRSAADGRDTYYAIDLASCEQQLRATGGALHPELVPTVGPMTLQKERGPGRRRVLFLCTGNSARSQMAEALAEQLSGGVVSAASAGSRPKPVQPDAVRVLRERGIDITGRRSKHLDKFAGERFDYVITLCDRVREVCPEFPHRPGLIHWSIPEPADHDAFERTAAELSTRIGFLIRAIEQTREVTERA